MSTFYSYICGNRGPATRCGSYDSGIRAAAQSWNGSVITDLDYRKNEDTGEDELMVSIQTASGSSCSGTTRFYGTLEELIECFNMYRSYLDEEYRMKNEEPDDTPWPKYDYNERNSIRA